MTDAQRAELARRANLDLERCRGALGTVRARAHGEAWDEPIRDALRSTPKGPAHALWAACERRWWRLAWSGQKLARSEARRFARRWTVFAAEDLEAYALLGLYRAAQTWNPEAGAFDSYARRGARTTIRATLRDLGGEIVDISARQHARQQQLRRALDELERSGRPRYLPWAAAAVGLSIEDAERLSTAGEFPARIGASTEGDYRLDLAAEVEPVEEQLDRRAERDRVRADLHGYLRALVAREPRTSRQVAEILEVELGWARVMLHAAGARLVGGVWTCP